MSVTVRASSTSPSPYGHQAPARHRTGIKHQPVTVRATRDLSWVYGNVARSKRQIGDICPKGHQLAGNNALVRQGSLTCRECWNKYMRDRRAAEQAELDALRSAITAARTRRLLDDVEIPEPGSSR